MDNVHCRKGIDLQPDQQDIYYRQEFCRDTGLLEDICQRDIYLIRRLEGIDRLGIYHLGTGRKGLPGSDHQDNDLVCYTDHRPDICHHPDSGLRQEGICLDPRHYYHLWKWENNVNKIMCSR